MRKVASTILCYAAIFILLFFALRMDEADTIFYTQNEGAQSVIEHLCAGEASIMEVKNNDTQLVSHRNETTVQFSKPSFSVKRDIRNFVFVILFINLLQIFSHSERVGYVAKDFEIRHRIAVLNYIHDLDGKKRIL